MLVTQRHKATRNSNANTVCQTILDILLITVIFTQSIEQFIYHCVNFGWWQKSKIRDPCEVIVGNFMTLKLPRFIRRITTVQIWAALLQALKEATCWVLKGQMVPQWQCYRAVHTQSLNDTLEINFFHFARVESIERIKLLSSSRLNWAKAHSQEFQPAYAYSLSAYCGTVCLRVYFSL